jgi:hypothetical protein
MTDGRPATIGTVAFGGTEHRFVVLAIMGQSLPILFASYWLFIVVR